MVYSITLQPEWHCDLHEDHEDWVQIEIQHSYEWRNLDIVFLEHRKTLLEPNPGKGQPKTRAQMMNSFRYLRSHRSRWLDDKRCKTGSFTSESSWLSSTTPRAPQQAFAPRNMDLIEPRGMDAGTKFGTKFVPHQVR